MKEEPLQPARPRHWLATTIKVAIVAVVVWFIWGFVVDAFRGLANHQFHVQFRWLAASSAFYLLGTLLPGLFWHRVLRTFGQEVGLWNALRAYYVGHLGKYVPGKAMVVILRAGLVRGPGVEAPLAVISVFLETLTMMAVGAVMAAVIVLVWFRQQPLLFWASLAMAVVAGVPTIPRVFRRLVRIAGLGRFSPATLEKLEAVGWGTVALGWTLNIAGWLLLGLSFWAVRQSLGIGNANPFDQLPLDTAAVALATVGGFLSFVPAGAVVREGALTGFMRFASPVAGGLALVAAVLLRLAWLAAELLAAAAFVWLGGTTRRPSQDREA